MRVAKISVDDPDRIVRIKSNFQIPTNSFDRAYMTRRNKAASAYESKGRYNIPDLLHSMYWSIVEPLAFQSFRGNVVSRTVQHLQVRETAKVQTGRVIGTSTGHCQRARKQEAAVQREFVLSDRASHAELESRFSRTRIAW
jgi:hypothetical protein